MENQDLKRSGSLVEVDYGSLVSRADLHYSNPAYRRAHSSRAVPAQKRHRSSGDFTWMPNPGNMPGLWYYVECGMWNYSGGLFAHTGLTEHIV